MSAGGRGKWKSKLRICYQAMSGPSNVGSSRDKDTSQEIGLILSAHDGGPAHQPRRQGTSIGNAPYQKIKQRLQMNS